MKGNLTVEVSVPFLTFGERKLEVYEEMMSHLGRSDRQRTDRRDLYPWTTIAVMRSEKKE